MTAFRFRWISSFMGEVTYECLGPDAASCGTLVLRRPALTDDYERQGMDEGQWDVFIKPLAHTIRWHNTPSTPVPAAVIDAFNAWLTAKWQELVARMDGAPERYGVIKIDDPVRQPPVPVCGASLNEARDAWVLSGQAGAASL